MKKRTKDIRKRMCGQESSLKEEQKQSKSSSLDFSLKCVVGVMDNFKLEFKNSFESNCDEEVVRRKKELPKQVNEFEEVISNKISIRV